jgi:hypothetical protein
VRFVTSQSTRRTCSKPYFHEFYSTHNQHKPLMYILLQTFHRLHK